MIHRKSHALETSVLKNRKIYKPSLYRYVVDQVRKENARLAGFDSVKAWREAKGREAIEWMDAFVKGEIN